MEEYFHPVSSYKVTSEYDGVRLDNCLISRLKGLPRTKIYSIIRKGEVRVNKSRSKPSLKLKQGDIIRIPPYRVSSGTKLYITQKDKERISESIIVKEKNYVIINKPAGVASHGGSGISAGVIEIIRELDRKYQKAQLVHRIDKDTSGCLVIALKKSFLRNLHEEIRNKQVDKIYDLVVFGRWPDSLIKLDKPLKTVRTGNGEREAIINTTGKEAITEFSIVKTSSKYSLLQSRIITGRMHQIRAHALHAGFPIVGDLRYGDSELNDKVRKEGINRMMLHARSINFKNLDLNAEAETPQSFLKFFS